MNERKTGRDIKQINREIEKKRESKRYIQRYNMNKNK